MKYIFLCPIPPYYRSMYNSIWKKFERTSKDQGTLGKWLYRWLPIDRTDSLECPRELRFRLSCQFFVSLFGGGRLIQIIQSTNARALLHLSNFSDFEANCRDNTPNIDWNLFRGEVFELDSVGYRSLILFWHNSGSSISSNQYNLILYDSYIIYLHIRNVVAYAPA